MTYASDKSILTIDTKAMALAAITLLFLTCLVYLNIWLIHEESVTRGFADPDTHDLNRLFLSGSCHVRRADRAPRCRSLSRDLGRTPYSLHDRSRPGQGIAKAFKGITNQSFNQSIHIPHCHCHIPFKPPSSESLLPNGQHQKLGSNISSSAASAYAITSRKPPPHTSASPPCPLRSDPPSPH